MATAVVVVVVVIVIALLVRFFVGQGPEKTARHESPGGAAPTTSDDLYRGTERPAGPDAESQDPSSHDSSTTQPGSPPLP